MHLSTNQRWLGSDDRAAPKRNSGVTSGTAAGPSRILAFSPPAGKPLACSPHSGDAVGRAPQFRRPGDRGAAAIVVERAVEAKVVQFVVPSTSRALGPLVARSLGDPAKSMTLVGVTGTNGKTTTTYLVESILAAAGFRPGVIGTVDVRW